MRVLTGTSGFSYPAWKGRFYPADLPATRMLGAYAGHFSAVEINNSFYRIPMPSTLAGWAGQVSEGFVFAFKAPRRITHDQRLAGVDVPLSLFYGAMAAMGEKLGPVLFQLPPGFKRDLPRLEEFLSLPLPGRIALEFRDGSWFTDEVFDALRARGAALCVSETEELSTPLVATTGWGYLRLRRPDYDPAALRAWADRIADLPWSEVFAFFKHEDQAKGPALAADFARIAGAPRG